MVAVIAKDLIMEHDLHSQTDRLIELGAVSAETKGPPGPKDDGQGQRFLAGLSDD
jgi:hypothetical protein